MVYYLILRNGNYAIGCYIEKTIMYNAKCIQIKVTDRLMSLKCNI